MKILTEVQFNDHNVCTTDIEKLVKADLKETGVKIVTIETLQIYYTPATTSVYYVATTKSGDIIENDEALHI